jgi:hypothetical protein
MAKLKVNITELKKIIKRAVNEAKVVPTGGPTLPSMYDKSIGTLFDSFGEGDSGFDLYEPLEETKDLEFINQEIEDNEDNERYVKDLKQIISLMKQHPGGRKFVTNNIFESAKYFPCPGAPKNSFGECVYINKDKISLYTPYQDYNGQYSVGWFDITGKYRPDTKNFDEDGNYIGRNA